MRVTIQFVLSKFAIAWMFALVTVNFNRIAILEFGISAIVIATMIGLYPLFGPFQPLFGRLTSRYPLFGYRRSPYLLLGLLIGALVFPPMPTVLRAMSEGALWAVAAGFVLFFIFGLSIALMANTYLDLIAECTEEKQRSSVFAAAWTGQTLIIVVWASLFRWLMPEFREDALEQLYTLTPFVVMALGVLSVLGLEKRRSKEELAALQKLDTEKMTNQNPVHHSLQLLTKNPTAQKFFLFIALCFMGIFSQDLLQEILGGEVFQMSVGESTVFQQIFNGTVTIGMAMTAAFGARIVGMPQLKTPMLPLEKRKTLAAYSGLGATLSFLLMSLAIAQEHLAGLYAAMAFNGLCVGVFAFCAVTMMSDMTVENETGRYLGLWSIAQAIGLGASFLVSGILHHGLVRSGIFSSAAIGYAVIFLIEAGFMLWCVLALRPTSVENLRLQAAPRQSATA